MYFQLQKIKKNCKCPKVWTDYTKIMANNYEAAVEIAVRMNRNNTNFNFRVVSND